MIFLLFGDLSEELNNLLPDGSSYTVDREVWVSEGHAGRAGRLDCVVSFAPHAVVVLELKTSTDAERSDTAKHEGYFNELARRQEAVKKAILIASSEIEVSDYSGFDLVTWAAFCTRARTLLIQLLQDENRLLLACLLAAFVSAVEQNILGYPTLDALRQNFYLSQLQFTRLASYLRVSEGD